MPGSTATIGAALAADATAIQTRAHDDYYRAFKMHHGFDLRKQSDANLERLREQHGELSTEEEALKRLWDEKLWPSVQLNHLTGVAEDIEQDGTLRSAANLQRHSKTAIIHTANAEVRRRCVFATLGLPGHRTAGFLSPTTAAKKVVVDLQAANPNGLWLGDHLGEFVLESEYPPVIFGETGCARSIKYHKNKTKERIYTTADGETIRVTSRFRDEVFSAHHDVKDVSDGLFYLLLQELEHIGDPIKTQLLEAAAPEEQLQLLQTLFNIFYHSEVYPEARVINKVKLGEHARIEPTIPAPPHVVHNLLMAAKDLDIKIMQKILDAYPSLIHIRNADNKNLLMILIDSYGRRLFSPLPDPTSLIMRDIPADHRDPIIVDQSILDKCDPGHRFAACVNLLLPRGIDLNARAGLEGTVTDIIAKSSMKREQLEEMLQHVHTHYGFGIHSAMPAPTLEPVRASAAAAAETKPYQEASVGLMIRNQGTPAAEILFVRKADKAGRPHGEWLLPGGLRDPAETPEQTVAREIAEETGLTTEETDWRHLTTFTCDEAKQQTHFYVYTSDDISAAPEAADDIAEAAWVRLADIKATQHPLHRHAYYNNAHIKPSNLLLAQAVLTGANPDDDAFHTQSFFEIIAPHQLLNTFGSNPSAFKDLLAQGADISNAALHRGREGTSFMALSPLTMCALYPEHLPRLLAVGADINAAQGTHTPLMMTCALGQFALAQELVTKHRADPFIVLSDFMKHYSAPMIACSHEEGLGFLQFVHAGFGFSPSQIGDLLVTSILNHQPAITDWLLETFNPELNQMYYFYSEGLSLQNQATPLNAAVQRHQPELVEKLLERGASPFDISMSMGLLKFVDQEVDRLQMMTRSTFDMRFTMLGDDDDPYLQALDAEADARRVAEAEALPKLERIQALLHAKRDEIVREHPEFFPKEQVKAARKVTDNNSAVSATDAAASATNSASPGAEPTSPVTMGV